MKAKVAADTCILLQSRQDFDFVANCVRSAALEIAGEQQVEPNVTEAVSQILTTAFDSAVNNFKVKGYAWKDMSKIKRLEAFDEGLLQKAQRMQAETDTQLVQVTTLRRTMPQKIARLEAEYWDLVGKSLLSDGEDSTSASVFSSDRAKISPQSSLIEKPSSLLQASKQDDLLFEFASHLDVVGTQAEAVLASLSATSKSLSAESKKLGRAREAIDRDVLDRDALAKLIEDWKEKSALIEKRKNMGAESESTADSGKKRKEDNGTQ